MKAILIDNKYDRKKLYLTEAEINKITNFDWLHVPDSYSCNNIFENFRHRIYSDIKDYDLVMVHKSEIKDLAELKKECLNKKLILFTGDSNTSTSLLRNVLTIKVDKFYNRLLTFIEFGTFDLTKLAFSRLDLLLELRELIYFKFLYNKGEEEENANELIHKIRTTLDIQNEKMVEINRLIVAEYE